MNIDRRDFIRYSGGGLVSALALPAVASGGGRQPGGTMATLTITFQGLCSLVLDREPGTKGLPKSTAHAAVILLDNVPRQLGEARHSPMLLFDPARVLIQTNNRRIKRAASALDPATLQRIRRTTSLANPSFLDIRDYELRIEGGDAGPIDLAGGRETVRGAYRPCPSNVNNPALFQDISWIANMEDVCGYGVVDPACLSMNPPRAVACRVSLPKGRIACPRPSDEAYVRQVWEFKPPVNGKVVRQSIADSVVFTATAPSFTLKLKPFDGVAGADEIPIELAKPQSGASVNLVVKNHPDADIPHPTEITHFAAQYYLLPKQQRPASPPIPTSVMEPLCAGSGGDHAAGDVELLLSDPNYCPMSLCFMR